MTPRSVTGRSLLLAGTFAGLCAIAWPATAQQPAAPAAPAPAAQAPTPPPSWQQGRSENVTEGMTKLAPVAPPPIPTAADKLPTAKLKLPKDFKIELYANRPNGIVLHNGTLYIAELYQISKIENIEDKLDNPPKPTVIYSDLPKDEPHGWKYLTVGPDNKLYFQVGAPCNICMPSDAHAQIRRINLDGTGAEVVARGIRQIVGMDWHPVTKQLYFTEHSRDWLSEDFPQDKLNRLANPGKDNFGFPYCHQGNLPDPEFGWGRSCDEFTKPLALLGPHAAPLGMRFYTGNMFPAEYRGAILIARHGSWNRTKKFGGDIAIAKLNKDGTVKSVEPFITGFIENNNYLGRPADVLVMKDGSLLVSDDYNGAVYRVSYHSGGVAGR